MRNVLAANLQLCPPARIRASDAQDLTQSFFAFFLRTKAYARADPLHGKFRSFLLASVKNFLTDNWDRDQAIKRGGDYKFVSLNQETAEVFYDADSAADSTAERLFELRWAKTLTARAFNALRKELQAEGKLELFEQLKNFLAGGSELPSYDEASARMGLPRATVKTHVYRLRQPETFDRKLTDIFGVESEIAKRIAESLQAKLTGHEEQALAVKPTNNPEAYDAYLRGLALEARGTLSNAAVKALDFYERAVQLDPNFAIAWARLSRRHAVFYFGGAATPARRDSAKRALENAQKLQPNSTETLLALGYYQYLVLRDYGLAKTTFTRVRKMLPGSSDVPYALGRVARYEGHWDETIGYFEQALALDPRNTEVLLQMAWTYGMLRQFPEALKLYDRVLDITPNDPDVLALKASMHQAQGNLQETPRLLSGINETSSAAAFDTKINQLRLGRNYGEAIRLLQARLAQFRFDSAYDKASEEVSLALIQCLAGDTVGARVTAEPARKTLEQLHRDQSENIAKPALADPEGVAILLSQAYAGMGEKDLALRVTEQAIVLFPEAKNRVHAPSLKENLALIQTMFGENSHAISTLTQLLQTPYWSPIYSPAAITPALLRLDPFWDPLRGDPRFQKLCEENQK
jgi:tetratricopeptide (TPR) repeat protein